MANSRSYVSLPEGNSDLIENYRKPLDNLDIIRWMWAKIRLVIGRSYQESKTYSLCLKKIVSDISIFLGGYHNARTTWFPRIKVPAGKRKGFHLMLLMMLISGGKKHARFKAHTAQ